MKVLHINPHYKETSTGAIVQAIHEYCLQEGMDSLVFYSENFQKGKRLFKFGFPFEKYCDALLTRFSGNRYGYAFLSTFNLLRKINKMKPDVVDIHCINSYNLNIYWLVSFLKKKKIPTVIVEHAEFFHTGNCSHAFDCDKWKTGCGKCPRKKFATRSLLIDSTARNWKKMRRAFEGDPNITLVCVSSWLLSRAKQSPVMAETSKICIQNGVDTSIFYPRSESVCIKNCFLEKDRFSRFEKGIILFVAGNGNDPNKGLAFLLKIAEKQKDFLFLVVGDVKIDPLYDNVLLLGPKRKEEMPEIYSSCQITLLLSKVETFSMVMAESLCCGTPVVGFECEGAESVYKGKYCLFSSYGNIELLLTNLLFIFKQNYSRSSIAEKSSELFASAQMAKKYCSLFEKITKEEI